MNARVAAVSILLAGLLSPGWSLAAEAPIETRHLSVSDATGRLSSQQLKTLADEAQATMGKVLAFWSADAGLDRFGKIRVVFDAPRRDIYGSVFYWSEGPAGRVRTLRVLKGEGPPQMLAHKLTSAVFPQKDKLIRNLMGIVAEAQIGNPLTFPMCGFGSDAWVLALLQTTGYIPLDDLGPDHESWGMRDAGGGQLMVFDRSRQHRAYAETGSFGNYLFRTFGVDRLKRLQRLSQAKDRPMQAVFGRTLQQLEADWRSQLQATARPAGAESARVATAATVETVETVGKLFESDANTACAAAQKLASRGR